VLALAKNLGRIEKEDDGFKELGVNYYSDVSGLRKSNLFFAF